MNHRCQSESIDGPKGGWNVELSMCLSIYLSIHLFIYPSFLSTDLFSVNLSISLFFHPFALLSICPCSRPFIILFLSMCPFVYLSFYCSLSRSVHFLVSLSVCRLAVYPPIQLSICPSSYPFYPFKYRSISPIHLCSSSFFRLDSPTASR